jgi:hypothetical protein
MPHDILMVKLPMRRSDMKFTRSREARVELPTNPNSEPGIRKHAEIGF